MNRIIASVIMVSIFIVGPAWADNFSATCPDVRLYGSELVAKCYTKGPRDKRLEETRLDLNAGIGCNDGGLFWGGKDFAKKCSFLQLQRWAMLHMRFDCNNGKSHGNFNLDQGISNINGKLRFDIWW